MNIVSTINDLRKVVHEQKKQDKKIGFVPTMGALHDGHLSLAKISSKNSDFTIMSIFVNRIQFNDKSDFDAYPVEIESDIRKAGSAGADCVFIPDEREMYTDCKTFVDMTGLTDSLCGAHRPGHFKGVFTVVSKLFNIVQPDIAVFGQKDIQQAVCIEKMSEDLNFPVRIIIAPIVRDADGLAMSSRNIRLSPEERKRALSISQSFREAEKMICGGETSAEKIIDMLTEIIKRKGQPETIDYISVVDYNTLSEKNEISGKCIIAIAAFFGKTRLIDNMIISSEGKIACRY